MKVNSLSVRSLRCFLYRHRVIPLFFFSTIRRLFDNYLSKNNTERHESRTSRTRIIEFSILIRCKKKKRKKRWLISAVRDETGTLLVFSELHAHDAASGFKCSHFCIRANALSRSEACTLRVRALPLEKFRSTNNCRALHGEISIQITTGTNNCIVISLLAACQFLAKAGKIGTRNIARRTAFASKKSALFLCATVCTAPATIFLDFSKWTHFMQIRFFFLLIRVRSVSLFHRENEEKEK